MDQKFKVGASVTVRANGKSGQVIGVLEELGGAVKYDVRSVDANGTLSREWFFGIELEEQAAAA